MKQSLYYSMAPVTSKAVSDEEILGLPKWAWAVIAGGVVTTGVLIYIFAGKFLIFPHNLFMACLFK